MRKNCSIAAACAVRERGPARRSRDVRGHAGAADRVYLREAAGAGGVVALLYEREQMSLSAGAAGRVNHEGSLSWLVMRQFTAGRPWRPVLNLSDGRCGSSQTPAAAARNGGDHASCSPRPGALRIRTTPSPGTGAGPRGRPVNTGPWTVAIFVAPQTVSGDAPEDVGRATAGAAG
jgi:hypothetical protein